MQIELFDFVQNFHLCNFNNVNERSKRLGKKAENKAWVCEAVKINESLGNRQKSQGIAVLWKGRTKTARENYKDEEWKCRPIQRKKTRRSTRWYSTNASWNKRAVEHIHQRFRRSFGKIKQTTNSLFSESNSTISKFSRTQHHRRFHSSKGTHHKSSKLYSIIVVNRITKISTIIFLPCDSLSKLLKK